MWVLSVVNSDCPHSGCCEGCMAFFCLPPVNQADNGLYRPSSSGSNVVHLLQVAEGKLHRAPPLPRRLPGAEHGKLPELNCVGVF